MQRTEIGMIRGQSEPEQLRHSRVVASNKQAHPGAETESSDQNRPLRKFRRQIIKRRPHIILFAPAFVVHSLTQSSTAKVEPQDGDAKLVQRLRRLENSFVVHGPAEQRMRVANYSDKRGISKRRGLQQRFELPCRPGEKKLTMEYFSHGIQSREV